MSNSWLMFEMKMSRYYGENWKLNDSR